MAYRVIIGHYPDYIRLAAETGAQAFNVPEGVWAELDETARWQANRDFLDDAIADGAEFILATPPDLIRPGSFLAREIEYLMLAGYSVKHGLAHWELAR